MKKKIDTSTIENELKGSSAFFRPRKEEHTQHTEEKETTVVPNDRTERIDDRLNRSVLTELQEGVSQKERPTERYSFEIYTDLKTRIEDIQYNYKRKTGKKLSASRMIREALEEYLDRAEEAL